MKNKVLIGVRVEADLDSAVYRPRDMADYERQIERAVKDFQEFVADHRSMDWVHLHVVREFEDQCSHCGRQWETDNEGVPVCCNEAVKEHEGVIAEGV